MAFEKDLNLDATELRLGLPGTSDESSDKLTSPALKITNKRALPDMNDDSSNVSAAAKKCDQDTAPPTKAQVVGWPPIQSYRKNTLQSKKAEAETSGIYVKVSMDGAPYLRKIDLKIYKGYPDLLKALEDMFKFKVGEYSEREGYNGSEFVPTYEDKMVIGCWLEMYHGKCSATHAKG